MAWVWLTTLKTDGRSARFSTLLKPGMVRTSDFWFNGFGIIVPITFISFVYIRVEENVLRETCSDVTGTTHTNFFWKSAAAAATSTPRKPIFEFFFFWVNGWSATRWRYLLPVCIATEGLSVHVNSLTWFFLHFPNFGSEQFLTIGVRQI